MNNFMLSVIGLLVGLGLTWVFEFTLRSNKTLRAKYWDNHISYFGYHIHHSTHGLAITLIGLALIVFSYHSNIGIFLSTFGLGVVMRHTMTAKKLVFIEKDK